ncbi:unnamed protein product [Nezara viridula]|uniref:SH3 domain-containing protein n=1 Tax=Nezara viridula TaxID=85310 RepID=A0A9P0HBG9_NEZVI|nr:unnamed protein product [Nezara viridula]
MPQPQDIAVQAAVALYDNTAESADELSFKSGDILNIVQQDSQGLEGWWICSLRGKQGICPSNRLRLLTEAELTLLRERRRRSWNTQSNKVVTPQKFAEGYTYDIPQIPIGTDGPHMQYDVPLNSQHLPAEESYDVPKPVGGGSLTPSSSISSLTTDSNRSSLIQQDYDIPRPTRLQPTQEEETCSAYDVPRSGAEVPMDLDSALDWLGRLESQITTATSRLLGCAGPHWRSPQRLEPRLAEIRGAVMSLGTSLHQLTVFIHPILLSQQDKVLGNKLSLLFDNLAKADVIVREASNTVDAHGWSVLTLGVEDEETHQSDALDDLVSTAALLTDDIRQIASFIQGNSTLLFKKSTPVSCNVGEDLSYMNLEKREIENEEKLKSILPPPLDLHDRKILDFYNGQYWVTSGNLSSAIDTLLNTVTQNQPPKAFLSHAKAVISWAHKLISIGDAVERNLIEGPLKKEVGTSINLIADATSNVVHKTKSAASHFPSVSAVQYMVDSVVDLSHKSKTLKQVLAH